MNKKYKKRGFLLIGLFLVSLSFVGAQNISVATESWEDCTNRDGTGLYLDILRAVFEPVGYGLDIQYVPYARSTHLVQAQRADVVIGPYEGELEKVIYPRWHYDNDDVSVVYRKGDSWMGEESFRGKKVAFMRGYAYNEYFDVPFEVTEVDSRETGYTLLEKGRVDFFIDAVYEIDTYREAHGGFSQFEVKHAKWLPMYFCFADNAKGRELADLYDRRFQELLDQGKIKALFDQWEFTSYDF